MTLQEYICLRRELGFAYALDRRSQEEVTHCDGIGLPQWSLPRPAFCACYASRKQIDPGLRELIVMIRRRDGLV
ncbi:hypothetical protein [Oceanicella sp. SM1341]|uniref:hypothetical protein n=1 Tax=Oceanicella sp. SM1341 TaxID=1548889 RepID=UPI000E476580|nr:hypothetical protein [Oceanicella sp. SM1341]